MFTPTERAFAEKIIGQRNIRKAVHQNQHYASEMAST